MKKSYLSILFSVLFLSCHALEPKVYWWNGGNNFGDRLSKVIVERIINKEVENASLKENHPVLLAIGSILRRARKGDIIWGSGFRSQFASDEKKRMHLDVRAVRGPKTRNILKKWGIDCPKVYGDPALLLPYLFPEFKKQEPVYDFIIIPHFLERDKYQNYINLVLPSEPWDQVVDKITKSKFVISSSLHGIIVAEAFGIPARLLKPSREGMLKYEDYYQSTGRPDFKYANTVAQALAMRGERPIQIDLQPLMDSFPYDYFNIPPRQIILRR